MARHTGWTERHLLLPPAGGHVLLQGEGRNERRGVPRAPVHRTGAPGMVRQHMGQAHIPSHHHSTGRPIPAPPQAQGGGATRAAAAHTRRRDERGEAEVLHEHQPRDTHAAHPHRLPPTLPHQGRQGRAPTGHLRPHAQERRAYPPPHKPDDGPQEDRQGHDGDAHGGDRHGGLRRRCLQPLHAAGT